MVLTAWLGGLVGRDARAQVETVDEAELLELVEGAIDACATHPGTRVPKLVLDLLGAARAGLPPEALDHRASRRPLLVAGFGEAGEGVLDPVPVEGMAPGSFAALSHRNPR